MTPEDLLPHLPQLRRFARLLTGEQLSGDAAVAEMLERLLMTGPPRCLSHTPVRIQLYRSLIDALTADQVRPLMAAAGGLIAERLKSMKPRAREAFLLVTVEEFSLHEAAAVLDMTPGDVARQLEEAGSEIARQIATTVLVIEDEPLIALMLENILAEMGHAVAGVAATKAEALSLVEQTRPGLILADIQLADGSSGLDAVREIITSRPAPAIFITAFPERLLTGLGTEPAFLITKPFDTEKVRAVVSQTLFFHG